MRKVTEFLWLQSDCVLVLALCSCSSLCPWWEEGKARWEGDLDPVPATVCALDLDVGRMPYRCHQRQRLGVRWKVFCPAFSHKAVCRSMEPGVSCNEALECVLGSDVHTFLWAAECPLVRLQQRHAGPPCAAGPVS